jgi:hypothetical protein
VNGAELPDDATLLLVVSGTGSSADASDFGGDVDPVVTPAAGVTTMVNVGRDIDGNGKLDLAKERELAFVIRVIDLSAAKIEHRRVWPTRLAENYFEINQGEILDTGSTFRQRLKPGFGVFGDRSLIRPQVLSAGQTLTGGYSKDRAVAFNFAPFSAGDDYKIRFYADANNSGTYNAGEQVVESSLFSVVNPVPLSYSYDVSDRLLLPDPYNEGAPVVQFFAGLDLPQRTAKINERVADHTATVWKKDSQTDFRAAVTVTLAPAHTTGEFVHVVGFAPDPIRDLPGDPNPDELAHRADMISFGTQIRFVALSKKSPGIWMDGGYVILQWGAVEGTDYAFIHEIGHMREIQHEGTDVKDLMSEPRVEGGIRNQLSLSQARKFLGLE